MFTYDVLNRKFVKNIFWHLIGWVIFELKSH